MGREIEVKARCSDLSAVRDRLSRMGARLMKSGRERNLCFDTPESGLHSSDSLLRLREYDGAVLTFKGPRADVKQPVKSRVELEVEVGDFNEMADILTSLGFVRVWAYEKDREEWAFGDFTVCLDTLPKIGRYVEVEGKSESGVMDILGKLGVPAAAITPQTYVEIFRSAVGASGWKLPDMVFEGEEGR